MIEQLTTAMVAAGTKWVLWLMAGLSVISVAIMLERAWFFWSIRDDIEALMRDLGKLLRGGDMDGARKRLEASPSAEAAVVVAGLVESDLGVEAAEEAMAGATALQRLKLERRLAFLGTLGNNAPFIGLLGTVIGIVGAFEELSKTSQTAAAAAGGGANTTMASEAVMASIAEALVATAVGLVIAIPAVAAFNFFQRLVKATASNTDALGHVLLAHLKADGEAAEASPKQAAPKGRGAGGKSAKSEDVNDEGAN
jgi:biopolymer transport protein ExbB